MVYKTEKHGVRTGNSFKRWNTKYHRQYKRQAYLIRSHICQIGDAPNHEEIVQFEKCSAFGEGKTMADGVEYSLNKQGRWDLPGILENIILYTDNEWDYGIQLIERHRINRDANCFNVCSTEGVYKGGDRNKERKVKTKTCGGYFQSNSVLKRAPVKRKRHRRRGRRLQEEDEEDEETQVAETNTLRYEVHYPTLDTGFLAHNAKAIGMGIYEPFRWTGYQDKRQRCRRRGRMDYYIKESLLCMDDSFDDSQEEDSVHEADDTEHDVSDFTLTLNDILKHATTADNLTTGKVRHASNNSSSSDPDDAPSVKGHVIYVEREDQHGAYVENTTVTKVATSTKRASTELHPVRVVIANEDVTEQTLLQKFGNDFIECKCFPRKFLLNISSQVARLDMFKTYNRAELTHVQACLVFVHDVDNEINNMKENVYKVSLNSNFNEDLNSVQIETVFDYMETNIDEIVERTLFFIETLPTEAVVCQNDAYMYNCSKKRSAVEECAKWSICSYLPNKAFLFDSFISRVPVVQEAVDMGFELVTRFNSCTDDSSDNVESPKDQFCCICYTTLEENNPGTALKSCSHWFCDACWKEYIETKINHGAINIHCPEYDCNKAVDSGTILSLINMREVLRYSKCCHDTEVEQQTSTRWCPNSKCGRVLKRNCEDAKNSKCICGVKVCFECLEAPHWPASCESVKLYYKKMRDTGDISVEPPELRTLISVRGKSCPSCHRFIEKHGGCPSIVCICHAHFCWGCGQLWSSRVHGVECYIYGYKDNHGTYEKQFRPTNPFEKKNRQKWYKMALSHRINQHEARLRSMKSYIKPLAIKLQHYIVKAEQKGDLVSLDFDMQDKSFKREADKTVSMLRNTVELYAEINHVVENTAVLINSEELPADSRLVLQHICFRLSSFSDVIFDLFSCHEKIQTRLLFSRLKEARFHSRKTFQSLIRCVRYMKTVKS